MVIVGNSCADDETCTAGELSAECNVGVVRRQLLGMGSGGHVVWFSMNCLLVVEVSKEISGGM